MKQQYALAAKATHVNGLMSRQRRHHRSHPSRQGPSSNSDYQRLLWRGRPFALGAGLLITPLHLAHELVVFSRSRVAREGGDQSDGGKC